MGVVGRIVGMDRFRRGRRSFGERDCQCFEHATEVEGQDTHYRIEDDIGEEKNPFDEDEADANRKSPAPLLPTAKQVMVKNTSACETPLIYAKDDEQYKADDQRC
jgi:hypothetical protein